MAGGVWSVYLLLCADGTFYCGITLDVPRRVAMHNGLLPGGAKYTRGRRPVRLVSCAGGFCRAEALRLERRIKKLPHARKAEALFAFRSPESREAEREQQPHLTPERGGMTHS